MSKVVKELVRRELVKRFTGVTSLTVVGFSGVDAVATNEIRKRLVSKGIQLTVIRNSLAKQAFKTVGLEEAVGLLDGPCAIATGGDNVVTVIRELLDIGAGAPELTVKAAMLDGEAFGPERIGELSKYPTREEALAKLAGFLIWPGSHLGGCLVGPGRKVASLVKVVEERQGGDGEPEGSGGQGADAAPSQGAAPTESAPPEEK